MYFHPLVPYPILKFCEVKCFCDALQPQLIFASQNSTKMFFVIIQLGSSCKFSMHPGNFNPIQNSQVLHGLEVLSASVINEIRFQSVV